eukprot:g16718.t1
MPKTSGSGDGPAIDRGIAYPLLFFLMRTVMQRICVRPFLAEARGWVGVLLGYRVRLMAEPAQLGDLDARLERLDAALKAQHTSLAIAWTLLTGFSIFFMQTGLTLREVGALRAASVRHILVKNLTALTLVAICWLPWGYCVAYGTTGDTLTFRECLRNAASFQPFETARMFHTFGFAAACNSVALGAVAERFALRGYAIASLLVSLLVFPVVVSWSWTASGLMRQVGFHDAAGSAVVFLTGGMLGLVAAWRVGARFGRFIVAPIPGQQTFDPQTGEYRPKLRRQVLGDFPGTSPELRLTGVLCMWFSFYSFNCHAGQVIVDEGFTRAPQIALVTTVAAAYAGLADLFWQGFRNRWLVHRGQPKQLFAVDAVSNSILTGLVAIAAGCDVASFWSAAVVGVVAVPVRRGLAYCLLQSGVDDPLEVGGVFCGGGLWGVLAVGILPNTAGLPEGSRPLFVAQLLGGLLAMAFAGTVGLVVFGLLHFLEQHCDSVRLLRRDFKKECWNHKEEEFRNNMKDLLKGTMALLAEPEEEIPDHVVQRMGFQTQAAREWRMFVQSVYADLPRLLDAHHLSKSDFCKASRRSSGSGGGRQQSPEESVSPEMDNMSVGQGQGLGNKLPHILREASFESYRVNGREATERCSVNGQEAVRSPSEHSLPSSDKPSLPLLLRAVPTPDGQRTPELICHNYHQPEMTRLGINQDDSLQSQIYQLTDAFDKGLCPSLSGSATGTCPRHTPQEDPSTVCFYEALKQLHRSNPGHSQDTNVNIVNGTFIDIKSSAFGEPSREVGSNYQDAVSDVPDSEFGRNKSDVRVRGVFDCSPNSTPVITTKRPPAACETRSVIFVMGSTDTPSQDHSTLA